MWIFTWKDVLVAEQRYKDMIAQAEEQRWARMETGGSADPGIRARWLYAFGERLVVWGCRLQARYQRSFYQAQSVGAQGSSLVLESPNMARNC